MTKNQIAFQQLQETKRANRAKEGLQGDELRITQRRDEQTIAAKYAELSETQRANRAKEDLHLRQQVETEKHNAHSRDIASAQLGIQRDTLSETERSNRARELETNRANVAKEVETARHQRATESEAVLSRLTDAELRRAQLSVQQSQATSQLRQASVAEDRLALDQIISQYEIARTKGQTAQAWANVESALANAQFTAEQQKYLDDANVRAWLKDSAEALNGYLQAGNTIWQAISKVSTAYKAAGLAGLTLPF